MHYFLTNATLKLNWGGANYSTLFKIIFFRRYCHHYIYILRTLEYHQKNKGWYHLLMKMLFEWRLKKWQLKTGISILPGSFGEGLTIYHHGSIVVNRATKVGKNCCIMNNVNIGANGGSDKAPVIGDNVYIGPGAVIYGDITIADGCYIGANAVVNKSFNEPYSVIAGVPAKVIKYDKVSWWEKNGLKRIK